MKVLVAPDKFKGSLTARQVAAHLAAGLESVPGVEAIQAPLADGGDGSVEAALAAGYIRIPLETIGPTGEPVHTSMAYNGETVIVEVASTCGISRLPAHRLRPLTSSSAGFGQAVRAALDLHPRRIILALGGSASTDGGLGMLVALGAVARDADGKRLEGTGSDLARLASLDLSDLALIDGCDVLAAADVDAPLHGPTGAALVFAPQKGADPRDAQQLDQGLRRLASLADPNGQLWRAAGAGAAGGIGFAALLLGARTVSGADFFLDLLGFDARVRDCALVVTAEGRLDDTTLGGKLPSAVAQRSAPRPVHVVTGRDVTSDPRAVRERFAAVHELSALTTSDTRQNPELTARLLASIGATIAAGTRRQSAPTLIHEGVRP